MQLSNFVLKHCATEDMLADAGTKALPHSGFKQHMAAITGWNSSKF